MASAPPARKPLPNLNKIGKKELVGDAGDRPPFSELLVKLVQKKPTYTMVFIATVMTIVKLYVYYKNYVPAEVANPFSTTKMQAVLSRDIGESSTMYIGAAPKPIPRLSEVLIQVKAFGISRMDILQREGKYPPPEDGSPILGIKFSGVVIEVGKLVRKLKVGDRVCGLTKGGAYAEYVAIEEKLTLPLPASMSYEQGAVLPEAFFTSYKALFSIGEINAGKTVLIHGGAGGIGSIALQLARFSGSKTIITTASTPEKAKHCEKMGATMVINYRVDDFEDLVLKATKGAGVDIIMDFIGGDFWNKNLNSLAYGGKLIMLGTLAGSDVFETNIGTILRKRLRVEGWDIRNSSKEELYRLIKEFQAKISPSLSRKTIRPVVDRVFSWVEISEAHQYLEDSFNKGKVAAILE
ncbi:hypothetical protein DSO57_1003437 [Entomophthora muscae]|uniref:Uncharacterized protein n=1 Tax=Entomophthora muscae TaxID=34485 RepID=A0ACC2UIP5_9FUNG|nr:hypothetical protein DSO57_1003437 [Entomophthora muscae]